MKKLWTKGLGRYVLRHPRALPDLVVAAWRLRRGGWWHRWPFLPVPDDRYWAFRMSTALGRDGEMQPIDVVAAATWSRRQRVDG